MADEPRPVLATARRARAAGEPCSGPSAPRRTSSRRCCLTARARGRARRPARRSRGRDLPAGAFQPLGGSLRSPGHDLHAIRRTAGALACRSTTGVSRHGSPERRAAAASSARRSSHGGGSATRHFARPRTRKRRRRRQSRPGSCSSRGSAQGSWRRACRLVGRRSWGRVQRLGPAAKDRRPSGPCSRPPRLPRVARAGSRIGVPTNRGAPVAAVLPDGPEHSLSATAAQTVDTIEHDAAGGSPGAAAIVSISERGALLAWSRDWDAVQRGGCARRSRAQTRFGAPFDVSPAGEQSPCWATAASHPPGTSSRRPPSWSSGAASTRSAKWAIGCSCRQAAGRRLRRPRGRERPRPRARLPAVAFDFNGRRWTAVWSQRIGPDKPGVPQSQITTFARSATRPG